MVSRLFERAVKMEIEIIPMKVFFQQQQTLPFRFKLKVKRGPETFSTKIYTVKSKDELKVDFFEEIFKR